MKTRILEEYGRYIPQVKSWYDLFWWTSLAWRRNAFIAIECDTREEAQDHIDQFILAHVNHNKVMWKDKNKRVICSNGKYAPQVRKNWWSKWVFMYSDARHKMLNVCIRYDNVEDAKKHLC